jgi:hypothetical protein
MNSQEVSYDKRNWTFCRSMLFILLTLDIVIIVVLFIVNYEHYDKTVKVIGGVWTAVTTALSYVGVQKQIKENISLPELMGLLPVQIGVGFYTIVLIAFLLFTQFIKHEVIIVTTTGGDTLSNVAIYWDGKRKGETINDEMRILTGIGTHHLLCQRERYKEKSQDIEINAFDLKSETIKIQYSDDDRKVGHLYVKSKPSGAEIWIDDTNKDVVTDNYIFNLLVGPHELLLKKDGYYAEKKRIFINEGRDTTVEVPFHRLTGSVKIQSVPEGAMIYLNGKYTNEKTPATLSREIGNYELELQMAKSTDLGFQWKEEIVIKHSTISEITKKFDRDDIRDLYRLHIVSKPSANISIDEKPQGRTNSGPVYLFEGEHDITLAERGYKKASLHVTIPAIPAVTDTIYLEKE